MQKSGIIVAWGSAPSFLYIVNRPTLLLLRLPGGEGHLMCMQRICTKSLTFMVAGKALRAQLFPPQNMCMHGFSSSDPKRGQAWPIKMAKHKTKSASAACINSRQSSVLGCLGKSGLRAPADGVYFCNGKKGRKRAQILIYLVYCIDFCGRSKFKVFLCGRVLRQEFLISLCRRGLLRGRKAKKCPKGPQEIHQWESSSVVSTHIN